MKSLISFVVICILTASSPVVALIIDFSATRVCYGKITTLIDRSVLSAGDSVQFRTWDLNGDGYFGDEGFTNDTVFKEFLSPGLHQVGLRIITYNGEAKAIYKTVYVDYINVAFSFLNGCVNKPIQFTDQSTIVGDETEYSYIWDFGDGSQLVSGRKPIHTYTISGSYSVILQVTSPGQCISSLPKTINIGDEVTVDLRFSGDTIFVQGGSVTAYVPPGIYDKVLWSTGETTESIIITKAGTYSVRVFVGDCYSDKSFRIQVDKYGSTPVIMTLFTPNGDGMNDKWEILNLAKVGPCEVNVYSRGGELVLSNSVYDNGWDGTYKGKELANDTYYYFVRCLDNILLQGTVNILK